MTDIQASERPADDLMDDIEVAGYLADAPDFFERHPGLLADLRLPHASGGTVSLVERQIEVLRGEAAELKCQIRDLIALARDNEALNLRLHRLTLALIDAVDFADVVTILEDHLHDQFRADAVELKLFSADELEAQDAAPQVDAFLQFFAAGQPVCGALSKIQLDYLFGAEADDVGSAALLPLQGGDIRGILAIGSHDAERFHPEMGTEFLLRLAEVVNHKLLVVSLPGV